MNNSGEKASFIWSVATLLRGPYRPNQYKDIMLSLTVLHRLDCVLEPTKDKVLAKLESLKGGKVKNLELMLNKVPGPLKADLKKIEKDIADMLAEVTE